MSFQIQYFPPSTLTGITSVVFNQAGKFMLHDIDRFASLPTEPATSRGPFQPGVSLLDNRIGGKRFSIEVLVWGDDREDYWAQRNTLVHALSVVPRFDQREAEAGLLRLSREGQDDIEIPVVPVGAPAFQSGGPLFAPANIEFFAPSPWWRSISDIIEVFESEGGIAIPHSSESDPGLAIPHSSESDPGLAIPLDQEESIINNDGHVPTPLEIRIKGQVDTARLILEETGETIGVNGVINAGETIRINTEFGKKEVTLIDSDGNESNAFDRLDADRADFFWLRRGTNTLRGTFTINVSGSMEVTWRKRFSGA